MRCKAKRKFSFRFQSREGGLSCPSISNDEKYVSLKDHEASERLETIEPRSEEHSIAGVVEDYQRENEIQSEVVCAEVGALGHGGIEQSMSDLLDGLQDRAVVQKGVSAKVGYLSQNFLFFFSSGYLFPVKLVSATIKQGFFFKKNF